jgi:hypothetical protein
MGWTCSLDKEVESDHFEPRTWKNNIRECLRKIGYDNKEMNYADSGSCPMAVLDITDVEPSRGTTRENSTCLLKQGTNNDLQQMEQCKKWPNSSSLVVVTDADKILLLAFVLSVTSL